MKTVGAFEAKTHFSELLRGIEQGETYEIRRRGKAIARLSGMPPQHGSRGVQETLAYFHGMRSHVQVSRDEIAEWRLEGRA